MNKGRLEAFSDGVFAIIITIMVLELKVPHGDNLEALKPLASTFLSYVLSFVYVGIYWNNHHHLMHIVKNVNSSILWGNLHLLFWLSLIPFVTAWFGENHTASFPLACYGFVLLMCGSSYYILVCVLEANNDLVKTAIGRDRKGKISVFLYAAGIISSFYSPTLSISLYVLVAAIWFIPDRRIERSI
ncbi:DUF1211 domain-containing protein [Duganella sp. FT135W]|uniref:DUF1211 domain-containing protein n=1 Tax=Duganella flavida TaxID=2692175 RepID=A0A6L8KGQ8_9BURK|nr:TMEM175 family protein [Duganella flavida]MYM26496.1 DUF1211 domain-containing protein [Duganella flavida]